jgi:hypothetical protein
VSGPTYGETNMRFMIIVKASQDSEAGKLPSQELLAAMGRYNEELAQAGILLSGEGLHPSSKGARVRFSGIVIDSDGNAFVTRKLHTPSDLVVDRGASTVRGACPVIFRVHPLPSCATCQKINSTISVA